MSMGPRMQRLVEEHNIARRIMDDAQSKELAAQIEAAKRESQIKQATIQKMNPWGDPSWVNWHVSNNISLPVRAIPAPTESWLREYRRAPKTVKRVGRRMRMAQGYPLDAGV